MKLYTYKTKKHFWFLTTLVSLFYATILVTIFKQWPYVLAFFVCMSSCHRNSKLM